MFKRHHPTANDRLALTHLLGPQDHAGRTLLKGIPHHRGPDLGETGLRRYRVGGLEGYPRLTADSIRAALLYAAISVRNDITYAD